MGDVNAVAEIITMFFLVTYGSLSLISFLQHFAADPSYRPTFKSQWYLSLLGAVMAIYLMFKINTPYALGAIALMVLLYLYISAKSDTKKGMASIFQGVIHQFSRTIQVFLQKTEKDKKIEDWRPSVLCLSPDSFERYGALELMKWISYRYGFGTYIHFEKAYFSKESKAVSELKLEKLIKNASISNTNVFLETIVSPSNTAAIVQAIQQPGISGKPNNMMLFEFKKGEKEWLSDIIENYSILKTANYDLCILASSDRGFGYKKDIHVWIRKTDYDNANLMILLSYIILGHPDWRKGEIKIFATVQKEDLLTEQENLIRLTSSGRLPISANNIRVLPLAEGKTKIDLINDYSGDADLTLIGFHESTIKSSDGISAFEGYDKLGNILFVNTLTTKFIS